MSEPDCTCSYEDSEEMTRHAPLCAISVEYERRRTTFTTEDVVRMLRSIGHDTAADEFQAWVKSRETPK